MPKPLGTPLTKRPTITDVATTAGVSKGTVSRYLNGRQWVSTESGDAVRAAIEQLGYVPNSAARNLAKDRTNTVALIFCEPTRMLSQNAIFVELLVTVTRELAEQGIAAFLMFADQDNLKPGVIAYLRGRHVDGAIMLSASSDDDFVDALIATGVPMVGAGPVTSARVTEVPFVGVDDAMGSRQAVDHLIATGHRRIGVVTGELATPGALLRSQAAQTALTQAGLEPWAVEAEGYSVEAGMAATAAILRAHPHLDALYVASDVLAIGALRVLRERGLRVPQDVAVVGFDDIPPAATLDPPLTTIATIEDGRSPVRLLLAMLEGKNVESVVLPTRLVSRASV